MIDAPTSTLTFLIADAEDSISSLETSSTWVGDPLARYNQILRKAVEDNGGSVFGTSEETFCAVFATVKQGVKAAAATQRDLSAERNGHAGEQVRMVLHTEVADERDGDNFGPPVDRAARLLSVGRGGQVLLSANTYDHVRDTISNSDLRAELRDLGEHSLENTRDSEQIFQLVVPDLSEENPPTSPYLCFDARYVLKHGLTPTRCGSSTTSSPSPDESSSPRWPAERRSVSRLWPKSSGSSAGRPTGRT